MNQQPEQGQGQEFPLPPLTDSRTELWSMCQGIPPLLQELASTVILPGDVPSILSPREWERLGKALGTLNKQEQRGGMGWDGNGDGVEDREEDVKRVEWDGNGVGMKEMGIEMGLDGVGKGMR